MTMILCLPVWHSRSYSLILRLPYWLLWFYDFLTESLLPRLSDTLPPSCELSSHPRYSQTRTPDCPNLLRPPVERSKIFSWPGTHLFIGEDILLNSLNFTYFTLFQKTMVQLLIIWWAKQKYLDFLSSAFSPQVPITLLLHKVYPFLLLWGDPRNDSDLSACGVAVSVLGDLSWKQLLTGSSPVTIHECNVLIDSLDGDHVGVGDPVGYPHLPADRLSQTHADGCESHGHGLAGPVGEINYNIGQTAHMWGGCVEILGGEPLEGEATGLQSVGGTRLTNLVPLRKLSVLAGYCSPVIHIGWWWGWWW